MIIIIRNDWIYIERRKILKKIFEEAKEYINACIKFDIIDDCDVHAFYRKNFDNKYWSSRKMVHFFWITDVEKMVN